MDVAEFSAKGLSLPRAACHHTVILNILHDLSVQECYNPAGDDVFGIAQDLSYQL